MNPDGFPRELLKSPVEDRIAYFLSYTMAHPKLLQAAKELMACIQSPVGSQLVFVFGPTGVGKSTLLQRTTQKIIESSLHKIEEDKSYIPIVGIEAAASEDGNFNWKDFYYRALKALNDPFLEHRMGSYFRGRIANTQSSSKWALRLAFETSLQQRHPDAFFIDEAQNVGKMSSGRRLKEQPDSLKSIANLTNNQFILVGTYELVMLRDLSAQLTRRSTNIHFPRYRMDGPQDEKIFRSIVRSFQRHLPLETEPNLLDHWELCYERSLGCVGILKDWLSRTLGSVLSNDGHDQELTIRDLERHAFSIDQSMKMLTEITEEERRLRPRTSQDELRAALGMDFPKDTAPKHKTIEKAKRKAVGTPKPKRRPVGKAKDAS
ncbi:ATP-binding protein [Leptothoe sp. LEGE 181152]|nr:ATP-binding protein [Leptothoe sp. LEGE 181152]